MKRIAAISVILLIVAAVCCATDIGKQTIIVTYVVPPVQPEFMMCNTQTGETGVSIVCCTDGIADRDVSVGFQIIQSNDCNWFGDFELTVCATELTAAVGGKVFHTDGVDIEMNGRSFGNSACMRLSYSGFAKRASVGDFNVTWPTSDNLVKAVYQATVSLNCTSR